jgi:D-alanyl-D-alanine carboxypeptidase
VAAAPSKLDLDEGDEIALIDAIKALITKSANDVAIAVAEHIAGSEEKFAKLMTQKAHQLGMAATTFRNASGLPDDEQLTTARDIATLALRLLDDFPKQYPLFATRTFTYNDETYRNHNTLLSHYPGTDGLKTGYTRASGFNLAASVRRGGKHVIGVVFGGATAASRNAAMRTYLNLGLSKASTQKTRKPASSPALVARTAPPAPEPRIAAVPAAQRVARVTPHPTPGSAPPAAPAANGQAAAAALSPLVEIARVRPVLIAPADTAEPAPADQPHSIEALLEEPSAVPDKAAEQVPPPRLRWITASAGGSLLPASEQVPPSRAPGTPPSSLDEQAADLARREAALAAVSAAPAADVVAPPLPAARAPAPPERNGLAAPGTFQIQVGAYQTDAEARRQLALVRERAPSLVGDHPAVTQPVKQGDKLFYRARYGGFDAQAAQQACSELKRLKVDCIVLKSE